jgi:hypothetical protein
MTAKSGTVGGWVIGTTSLISTNSNSGIASGTGTSFWAGGTSSNAVFRVANTGALTATNVVIDGTISSGTSNTFRTLISGGILETQYNGHTSGGLSSTQNGMIFGSASTALNVGFTLTGAVGRGLTLERDSTSTHVSARTYLDGTKVYINGTDWSTVVTNSSIGAGLTSSVSSHTTFINNLLGGLSGASQHIYTNVCESKTYMYIGSYINAGANINAGTYIYAGGNISGASITNRSSEKIKNNIAAYSDSALNKINSSVLYSYNLKSDKSGEKLMHGLIIERETPSDIISRDGDGIDLYSMNTLSWKAIQELSSENKKLNNRILKLENMIKGEPE